MRHRKESKENSETMTFLIKAPQNMTFLPGVVRQDRGMCLSSFSEPRSNVTVVL